MQSLDKQIFEQAIKDRAVFRVLNDGTPAAAVARELGVPAWLVQNWVRIAKGTNKRTNKALLENESRLTIDDKEYAFRQRFAAYDSHRNRYIIHVFREASRKSADEYSNSQCLLFTSRKLKVTRIRKGLYKLPSGAILESDDPEAA